MSSAASFVLVVLALALAPAALSAQSSSGQQDPTGEQDLTPTAEAVVRPPAEETARPPAEPMACPTVRFSSSSPAAALVPRVPALSADSVNPDRNAGLYALGGAFVGLLVALPIGDEVARRETDCMGEICTVPVFGTYLLGAGLGAIGGLIVRKIVQH